MRELARDLWVCERPLQLAGVDFGTRMTVVRLGGGDLWLHSPVKLDDGLRAELESLGTVRFAVAPNRFHHLFIAEYPKAYPRVELWAAPGIAERKPDVRFAGTLGIDPPPWLEELEQAPLVGAPRVEEFEFFHPPTRTLIATDLVFNFPRADRRWARVFLTFAGAHARLASSRLFRSLVRDRAAFARSLEPVLAWDFERVVLAHGDVLERDAARRLREALAWAGVGA